MNLYFHNQSSTALILVLSQIDKPSYYHHPCTGGFFYTIFKNVKCFSFTYKPRLPYTFSHAL